MSIVNHDTGEIVEALSVEQARRLTDRIRLLAESVAESLDKMADLIDQARTGSAWLVLGYRSWPAYVAEEFSGVLPRLGREPRQEFVRELTARGMSTRAIAPVVGVNNATVHRDLAAPVASATPRTPAPRSEGEAVAERVVVPQGEGDGEAPAPPREVPAPRPAVTGLDGKTYASRPRATEADLAQHVDSDTSVQDSRYMKAVLSIARGIQPLGQYDAERVAEIADQYDALAIDNLAETVAEFHRKFTAKRSGLRVIKGGAR